MSDRDAPGFRSEERAGSPTENFRKIYQNAVEEASRRIAEMKLIAESLRQGPVPSNSSPGNVTGDSSVTSLPSEADEAHGDAPSSNDKLPILEEKQLEETMVIQPRQYQLGFNLFNEKPEVGISYMIDNGFVNYSAESVAEFLLTAVGLSRQIIGQYLGDPKGHFHAKVMEYYLLSFDFVNISIDVALRKLITKIRIPDNPYKTEFIMKKFGEQYCFCNRSYNIKTVSTIANSIYSLNHNLHSLNVKPKHRMTLQEFVNNNIGIDTTGKITCEVLAGYYHRVQLYGFKTENDHVTDVQKVESSVVGKNMNLAVPHRRLIYKCTIHEIKNGGRKLSKRKVFLFNNLLLVTKIFDEGEEQEYYIYKMRIPLCGVQLRTFTSHDYRFGMTISKSYSGADLISFSTSNDYDRQLFSVYFRDSVAETEEMANVYIMLQLKEQLLDVTTIRSASEDEEQINTSPDSDSEYESLTE